MDYDRKRVNKTLIDTLKNELKNCEKFGVLQLDSSIVKNSIEPKKRTTLLVHLEPDPDARRKLDTAAVLHGPGLGEALAGVVEHALAQAQPGRH